MEHREYNCMRDVGVKSGDTADLVGADEAPTKANMLILLHESFTEGEKE